MTRMAEGVGVHPQSEVNHLEVRTRVILFGSLVAASSLPSVPGVVLAGVTSAFAYLNIRSGVPMSLAGTAWKNLAEDLESERKRLLDEAKRIRGGGDDLWKGPGAEAFVSYVEKRMAPNIAGFKSVCEAVDKELDKQASTLGDATSKYYWDQVRSVALNIAAIALYSIPKAGPILHQIAVVTNNVWNAGDVWSLVEEAAGDLREALDAQGALGQQSNSLGVIFGFEGERVQNSPTGNRLKDAIPPVVATPNQWGKD
jgi:hypothetical protein